MNQKLKLLTCIILLAFTVTNCSDDDDDAETVVITVDDAAEYVAATLTIATYGAVYNMNYVAEQITDLIDCNESESDVRTETETSNNGDITVNFTINESYSRLCSGSTEAINYNFSADQTTTSDRVDSDTKLSGVWTITGAESTSSVYVYNGNYTRGGEWTYNLEDNHTDNVTASYVFNNVKANKDDSVIFEGTSTFSLAGFSTIYEPFSYEGSILFQADNTCIVTFSTGEQYKIDLNTGDVVPL
jgi:hypothetical protein